MMADAPHVLIVVQNLPVPLDRRVWLECQALVASGYRVSVICPSGPGDPPYAEIDGVRIWKYRPPPEAGGPLGYLYEFGYCWLRTAWLARRIWRRERFDVLQACNPPDTYWALAVLYRRRGVRFVYDQHDLNPEVFRSRFGEPRGLAARAQYRVLLWLERRTYRAADHVIATNESYRQVAIRRGGRRPEGVTVVRSGPDTSRMRPVRGRSELRGGRRHLVVYLGVMGPQDGVDIVLRAVDVLVHRMDRDDVHVALLGFGDCYDELVDLAHALDLDKHVTFTGRADHRMIAEYLSTADIGLSPDPKSPLNDVSTMNKTMEYMSYAVPVVAFDLAETRVSAGEAAVYVESTQDPADDVERYANAVAELLDDADRRAVMAVAARRRAVAELDWAPQRQRYVSVFDRLLGLPPRPPDTPGWPAAERRRAQTEPADLRDEWGNPMVDLRDTGALDRYVRDRGIGEPLDPGPAPAGHERTGSPEPPPPQASPGG
jgi:glycosyltransferase involved in cell wall biosynthesis